MPTSRSLAAVIILICLAIAIPGAAFEGTLIDTRVHSPALDGNPLDDDAVRDVTVYLPSGYYGSAARYPVIYLLHAYGEHHNMYHDFALRFDELVDAGRLPPAILVMPDANNALGGSWYTNSSRTGNWEDFIAVDLVAFTDSTYRTISESASRGIAGQSMGGFGAMRVAMRRADVFGAVYAIDGPMSSIGDARLQGSGGTGGSYAAALEYPQAEEKLAAAPLGLLPKLADNVAALRGIGLVVGAQDGAIETNGRAFSEALTGMGIVHEFRVHDGGHSDNFESNLEDLALPFLVETLEFDALAAAPRLDAFAPVRVSTAPGAATAFDVTARLHAATLDPTAEVWLDLTAIGAAAPMAMTGDGDGTYQAPATLVPPASGRYDLPVRLRTADGSTRILWHIAVTAWPAGDREILSEGLADDWEMTPYRAEILDLAQTADVHTGGTAAHVRVPTGFAGWKITLAPAGPLRTTGYTALRMALRPQVPEPGRNPQLILATEPGGRLELQADAGIDLAQDTWQVVEIPLSQLQLQGPLMSLELQGNFGGELYVDDLCLVAAAGAPSIPTAVTHAAGNQPPQAFALQPNYPNPFNSGTVIPFTLSRAGHVEVGVYDLLGQRVVTLVDGPAMAGSHATRWDGRDASGRPVASGAYVFRLSTETEAQSQRLLLLR